MRRVMVVALCLLALPYVGRAERITVLFTNDLHARETALPALAEAIAEERLQGLPVLLLDAGDAWHDFRQPIRSVWGDARMIEWMGEVAYNAMALGNHDAYYGSVRLLQSVRAARFPVLCANWRPRSAQYPVLPSVIASVGRLQVLLIGVTTDEFLPFSAFRTFAYRDPIDAIREEIARHSGRFQLAIVLGHLGVSEARRIARSVPEIALLVTGHSHEETAEPIMEGETIIVQTGAFGRNLGRLVLEVGSEVDRPTIVAYALSRMEPTPEDNAAGLLRLLTVSLALVLGTLLWLL